MIHTNPARLKCAQKNDLLIVDIEYKHFIGLDSCNEFKVVPLKQEIWEVNRGRFCSEVL